MSRLLVFAIALSVVLAPRSALARDGDGDAPALEPTPLAADVRTAAVDVMPPGDGATPPGAVIINAVDDDVFNPADAPPSAPSCCCCRRHLDHSRRTAVIMGLSLIGSGFLLTLAHAATVSDFRIRQIELIPVGGAIYAETRNGVPPSWSAALMFAAWSQAMGVLVLAIGLAPEDAAGAR